MSAVTVPFFGELLKRYRLAANLTQEQLAERAGLSVRAISDLERGINRTPRQETLDLLARALALSPHKQTYLLAAARPHAATAHLHALATLSRPDMPLPPTRLIGRERELGTGMTLLRQAGARLVTLTGPGGVGKTHLALQIAEEVAEYFEDGVRFVGLAAVRDPALLLSAIAEGLDLREGGGSLEAAIVAGLGERDMLLVLDNFEHLLPEAPVVATLLARCPRLKVLVTSRARLRLRGEHELAVAPLELRFACALFQERAHTVRGGALADGEEAVVAEICERLDRLPLAIELAAEQTRVLSLSALLARMEARLPLLGTGARDLPERQRTMRDAIAWSYSLLPPFEQRVFRRLAVFVGGATLEAVEAICGEANMPGDGGDGFLPALAALVDHSLVMTATHPDGSLRFSLLETIREYGVECARGHDELATLRRRHAEYYATLAAGLMAPGPGQELQDARLTREFANLRAALAWAREQGEAAWGLRLAANCGRLWYMRGMRSEGSLWLEEFLALDAAAGARAAEPIIRLWALYGAGRLALERVDIARAEAHAREARLLAERLGDQVGVSNALAILGEAANYRGEVTTALALWEECVRASRVAGDETLMTRNLTSLGHAARAAGDFARARECFEESLAIVRRLGVAWGEANSLTSLGHLARDEGNLQGALAFYRQSLPLYQSSVASSYVPWCLEGVAAALSREQPSRAVRLCGASAAARAALDAPLPPAERHAFEALLQRLTTDLGEEAFSIAWRAGQALSLDAAIALAMNG